MPTRKRATKREAPAEGTSVTYGDGTVEDPWVLKTPSLASEFRAWRDESQQPPALVVQVGSTRLSYLLRGLDDLVAMLRDRGDWVALGSADEGKPTPEGSIEAWARARQNPAGGYYGLRRATGAASRTTSPRCWSTWGSSSSSTARRTTAPGR